MVPACLPLSAYLPMILPYRVHDFFFSFRRITTNRKLLQSYVANIGIFWMKFAFHFEIKNIIRSTHIRCSLWKYSNPRRHLLWMYYASYTKHFEILLTLYDTMKFDYHFYINFQINRYSRDSRNSKMFCATHTITQSLVALNSLPVIERRKEEVSSSSIQ